MMTSTGRETPRLPSSMWERYRPLWTDLERSSSHRAALDTRAGRGELAGETPRGALTAAAANRAAHHRQPARRVVRPARARAGRVRPHPQRPGRLGADVLQPRP